MDGLIKKLYESYATGNLTEKRFKLLSSEYEREQEELDAAIEKGQMELDVFNEDTNRADQFLALAKQYTDFSVLTTPMIRLRIWIGRRMMRKIYRDFCINHIRHPYCLELFWYF